MLLHSDYPDSNPTVLCSYSLKLEAGVVSLEGDNLVVFYYLRDSEIW
jgi:hypothetical protein